MLCSSPLSRTHDWLLINGFWSLFLAFGLLYCAWTLHHARSWRIGPTWMRTFLADYGVVSMVNSASACSPVLKAMELHALGSPAASGKASQMLRLLQLCETSHVGTVQCMSAVICTVYISWTKEVTGVRIFLDLHIVHVIR